MQRHTRVPFDHRYRATSTTGRARRIFFVATLPLLGGLLAYVLLRTPATHDTPQVATPAEALSTTATSITKPFGEKIHFIVRHNDTLEKIFRRLKLNLDDLAAILHLPNARQNLAQIRPGDKVTVVHNDGVVHELNHRISTTETLSVTRGNDGFSAEVITTPLEVKRAYAHGTIKSSLFSAARGAGVSPETIMRLANDIFGWDIDFALDIRPGDRFRLVYEQNFSEGQYVGDGRIIAAEFVNNGEVHRAIHYTSADGQVSDYFTPEGRSLRRQFVRAPLDFTRISSNFNPSRRHPLLNTIRAHQGVDYAAPTGTVIKAAGDGRIAFIGIKGGYGKVAILEHGGGISTLYGHMSRFAQGKRIGQRVKQGETIGYVGSTGAATGPHLHYEYRINGTHENPRTVQLPDAAPLPAAYVADFQSRSEILIADLQLARDTAVASLP